MDINPTRRTRRAYAQSMTDMTPVRGRRALWGALVACAVLGAVVAAIEITNGSPSGVSPIQTSARFGTTMMIAQTDGTHDRTIWVGFGVWNNSTASGRPTCRVLIGRARFEIPTLGRLTPGESVTHNAAVLVTTPIASAFVAAEHGGRPGPAVAVSCS